MADSTVDEAQVRALADRYGEPLRWKRVLPVPSDGYWDWAEKKADRPGEVLFVIPRPGRRYLALTKSFYPERTFRLPTGGIHSGERVMDAFCREVREETGFESEPERFVGVVEHVLQVRDENVPFVTYILITPEISAVPSPQDVEERISEFREVSLDQVETMARKLEGLSQPWTAWGRFRAAPHELVVAALSETGPKR